MEQKLHTPEGVRDIYNKECETKLTLQRKLNKVLHLYGYQDIQTPTFEYYEVFRKEIGSTSTQELYKFFDREGNILALRPDITPSVARAAATLFESEDMPIRLCYAGNTFINHSSYQGRLKENTQLGAELIGLDSVEADAEMLAMVVDSLKQVGLEEFQVSLGHVDFIQSLLKAAVLEEDENREIRALITNRNFFGVEEILDAHQVKESIREAFRLLPELTGGPEVLELAMGAAPDLDARLAVTRLQQIFRLDKALSLRHKIQREGYASGLSRQNGIFQREYLASHDLPVFHKGDLYVCQIFKIRKVHVIAEGNLLLFHVCRRNSCRAVHMLKLS